jgi:regulator of protease activity HflC (stomatin/prohibitin superfamily)
MMAILEKLLDLLQAWISYIIPFHVMGDDQCGLVRRLGRFHRYMRPGLNWKIPVLEQALTDMAALSSTVLREQSLTTSDGVQVTLRGVITYRVIDAKRWILDCDSAQSVMNDVGCCVIAELVPGMSSEEILSGETAMRELTKKVRVRAKRWGVEVDSFGLVDRVQTRTYRFITASAASGHDPHGV